MHPITTRTMPDPEPAPVTLDDLLSELDAQGWHEVHGPNAITVLREADLDYAGTYYTQPDGIAVVYTTESERVTCGHEGDALWVDGCPVDTLDEAIAALEGGQ